MLEWIDGVVSDLVMKVMFGEQILTYVDQYFTNQTPAHQVLIVYGVGILSVFGAIVVIRSIIKKVTGLLKFVLLLGIAYYIVVIVMGVDILGMIFG